MVIRRSGSCAAGCALASFLVAGTAWGQGSTAALEDESNDSRGLEWTADANVGALSLESSNLQLAGDLTLGIGQDGWGVVGWGSGSAYELENDARYVDTTNLEGYGDAWLNIGSAADPVRFVVRGSGGGANYASTVVNKLTNDEFSDQTSWMGRGALLFGAALQPNEAFFAYLGVGGGLQYEWYDTTAPVPGGVALDDNQELTLMGNGRLDVTWVAARDIVSFRLRTLASYFKLTRNRTYLSSVAGTSDVTIATFSQLDTSGRLFVDVDAASFVGFRPTLHGGFDFVRTSGQGETESTFMPVFGGGILRPWM